MTTPYRVIDSKAILFGINYNTSPKETKLRGCINDVNNMAKFLKDNAGYDLIKVYTDEVSDYKVKGQQIVNAMYKLAIDSHRYHLKRAWIHFSGHGCSIRDANHDETDGKDECIVPADYNRCGVITDDLIKHLLRYFHEDTKVTCVFDCCHSGTIGDLQYRYLDTNTWTEETDKTNKCIADVTLLSGCMDCQTSADAYNVQCKRQFTGAMTSCLLMALKDNNKTLDVLEKVRTLLKRKRFTQYPQLTCSNKLNSNSVLY